MRESIGILLYVLFIVLTVSGAALGVAAASVLLHRRRIAAGIDVAGVHAGSRTQLRRYGLCWLVLACVWLIGAGLVTRI